MTDDSKFRISLEDKVSESAKRAKTSVQELENSFEKLRLANGRFATAAQVAALKSGASMQSVMGGSSHGGGGGGGKGWFHELYESEVIRRSITGITSGLKEMGAGFKTLDAEKILGGATESASGFAESISLINPIAGAAAAGIVKLYGAVASLSLGMVETALEVTNTNQRLEATFTALSGGPAAGKATLGMLNELSSRLPQSREQLADWAKEFGGMGITNVDQVRAHLVATASAAAIMGESGAEAYIKLQEKARLASETGSGLKLGEKPLERLYKAGVDVTDIATRLGVSTKALKQQLEAGTVNAGRFGEALEQAVIDKGKGPLDVMMSSLSALKTKGLEMFGHLFDGIDTKPLTDAIKSVIELGDQAEPSGQALKEGITTGVNGIIHDMAHAITRAEIFFLKLELGALKSRFSLSKVVTNLKDIGEAAAIAAKPVMAIFDAMKWIFDHSVNEIGASIFSVQNALADADAKEDAYNRAHPAALKPHASGGIVTGISNGLATVAPANGEGLVSIGAGERIVPSSYGNLGGMMAQASNTNNQSHVVHIGQVVVQAPGGVTDAHAVTVTGLTIALERLQLASAR